MIRRVSYVHFKEGTSPAQAETVLGDVRALPSKVPSIARVQIGANLRANSPISHMWDMEFTGENAVQAYQDHPYHVQKLVPVFGQSAPTRIADKFEPIYYSAYRSGTRSPGMRNLLRRVMAIQVKDGTPKDKVAELEEMLLGLPREAPSIGNFSLGHVLHEYGPPNKWTHVWELEFADQAGMTLYDKNRYHLEDVAPYFRAGGPKQIVEAIQFAWVQTEKSFIAK